MSYLDNKEKDITKCKSMKLSDEKNIRLSIANVFEKCKHLKTEILRNEFLTHINLRSYNKFFHSLSIYCHFKSVSWPPSIFLKSENPSNACDIVEIHSSLPPSKLKEIKQKYLGCKLYLKPIKYNNK